MENSRSEHKPLVHLDLSPISLDKIKKSVARAVNVKMGIKDGGNISIAAGCVLYPPDQEAKRKRVLGTPIEI